MSADVINVQADASSLRKGESLLDTVHNIRALQVDIVVIRHSATGAPNFLARSWIAASSMQETAHTVIPHRRCWIFSPSGKRRGILKD